MRPLSLSDNYIIMLFVHRSYLDKEQQNLMHLLMDHTDAHCFDDIMYCKLQPITKSKTGMCVECMCEFVPCVCVCVVLTMIVREINIAM